MSHRRRRRWLEGTDLVPQYLGHDIGLQLVASRHVDGLRDQLLNLADDAGVVEQVDLAARIELDEQIDVAVGSRRAARRRAEDRKMPHAEKPQLSGIRLQR